MKAYEKLPEAVEFIEKHSMLSGAEKVLCAVSGGADSMCLLHFLQSYLPKLGIKLAAAHFNHCLRGAESDRDEAFVKDWCLKNGIELYTGRGDVRHAAESEQMTLEEAARELRYAFLEETAAGCGADRIATAHNCDDQLETVLMNLSRGSGATGLAGIPPVRGQIIRPLLQVTRTEINEYLEAFRIPHVEDSTNGDNDATRNAVRHSVVPALKAIFPRAAESASRCADIIRHDDEYLDSVAAGELRLCGSEGGDILIPADKLNRLPYPIASRLLQMAADELSSGLSETHVKDILRLASSQSPSGALDLPGGLRVRRRYGDLLFTRNGIERQSFEPSMLIPGEWVFPPGSNYGFYLYPDWNAEKINPEFNIFLFEKSSLCGRITVRPRKTGDRIKTASGGVTKTLKKLFIEKKIPVEARDRLYVIADDIGPLAVEGVGRDVRTSGRGEKIAVAVKQI